MANKSNLSGILGKQAAIPKDIAKGFGGPIGGLGEGVTGILSNIADSMPKMEMPVMPKFDMPFGGKSAAGAMSAPVIGIKTFVQSAEDMIPIEVPKLSDMIPDLGNGNGNGNGSTKSVKSAPGSRTIKPYTPSSTTVQGKDIRYE